MEKDEALKVLQSTAFSPTVQEALETLIPELKESEDERIRKAILCALLTDEAIDALDERGITHDAAREYLEKQKEQPMPNSTKLITRWDKERALLESKDLGDDKWRLAYNAFMDGFSYGVSIKQKEQTKEEKEYVRTLHSLISDFLYGKQEIDREYYQRIWEWLEGRHIEQKQAEWSEEERYMLEDAISGLQIAEDALEKDGNKNLPKALKKAEKWLKSLRPQPHWKPSEEQMRALKYTAYHISPQDNYRQVIFDLYNDLLKL